MSAKIIDFQNFKGKHLESVCSIGVWAADLGSCWWSGGLTKEDMLLKGLVEREID